MPKKQNKKIHMALIDTPTKQIDLLFIEIDIRHFFKETPQQFEENHRRIKVQNYILIIENQFF